MRHATHLLGFGLEDARGLIQPFYPPAPIVEAVRITYNAGAVRGLHWHPGFNEIVLFLSGKGVVTSRDIDGGATTYTDIYPGLCIRFPIGVAHAVRADEDTIAVALLDKRWDDCDPPLVRFEL